MTPYEIDLILWHHVCREPWPKSDAPIFQGTIDALVDARILEPMPMASGRHTYATTDRGKRFVEMLCETPFPEQRWIDPREENRKP